MNLLTIPEVAKILKISQSTVRRLINRGDLTAFKVGDRGQLRIEQEDLMCYVSANRVKPPGKTTNDEIQKDQLR